MFLNYHPANGCDNVREQFQAFCLERGFDLEPNSWQISNRLVKLKNPHGQGFLTTHLWLDCTKEVSTQVRAAARLLKPTAAKNSAYPLLYNLYFVPANKFMDIGPKEQYELAKIQKKFVDNRFT